MTALTNIYIPILKGKSGEFEALSKINPGTWKRIIPLLEIIPFTKIQEDGEESLVIAGEIEDLANKIGKACANGGPVILDFSFIEEESKIQNSGEFPSAGLCALLKKQNIGFLCAVSPDSATGHIDFVRAHLEQNPEESILLRIRKSYFDDADNLGGDIRSLIDSLKISPDRAILMIDLESVTGDGLERKAVEGILRVDVPEIDRWQRIYIAGSSFPKDLTGITRDTIHSIVRQELILWRALKNSFRKDLQFSDYTIAHPGLGFLEFDPLKHTTSASIRYTSENCWHIFRGRALKKRLSGLAKPFEQFYSLALKIVNHSSYCGKMFSWGDNRIDEAAQRIGGTGNLATWRAVATNHHIEYIVSQDLDASSPDS